MGIAVLARPIVQLVFEHGLFTADNTTVTVQVLLFYLVGVIPAALDLLLVNAFYARQDPLTPSIGGVGQRLILFGSGLGLRLGVASPDATDRLDDSRRCH